MILTLGELEFSDQDDFSNLEGPHEIRVKPPPGFKDDLDLIGSKFNHQDQQPEIQSSIGQLNNQASLNPFANLLGGNLQPATPSTPTLPNLANFNPLAGLTQEQIQQLALIQYLKNFQNQGFGLGGLGFGLQQPQQPQVSSSA